MKASPHTRIAHLFGALALTFLLLLLASCGGGGSGVPAEGGSVIGNPSAGGSEGSAGGADGADGGNSGNSASSGGIGGTGGTAGDGSNGDTGTADSGVGGGGGIGGTGSPSTAGTVHFYLADAPSCGYEAVYVTVEKVRIHASGGASDADKGWSEVAQIPPKRVDLLTLTNGVVADLGQTSLPAGKYKQLRLVLAANGAQAPFPNAVVPIGGAETDLKVPSGSQSGLKIDADVDIVAGRTTQLVLDFDACKSVVRRGNSGQFNLRPVISAIPLASEVGLRITGYVAPGLANASTKVSVQVNGVPVRSTAPESTGRFVLYPVPAGAYDLVVTSGGRAAAVVTDVPVTAAVPTAVSSAAQPIDPPPSVERGVRGTVDPPSATVRALQTLSGGRLIEVGWAPVDALSGSFAFTLPTDAPIRASYVASPAAPAFTADPTAAGNVTLEATSATERKVQPVNLSSPSSSVTFTFP